VHARISETSHHEWKIDGDLIKITEKKKLGEGSFGVVWKGEFKGTDVAIKKLKPGIYISFFS